jgi:hypothetical protein
MCVPIEHFLHAFKLYNPRAAPGKAPLQILRCSYTYFPYMHQHLLQAVIMLRPHNNEEKTNQHKLSAEGY